MPSRLLRPITALYLLAPAFLFAAGWLRFPYDLIILLVLAFIAALLVVDLARAVKEIAITSRVIAWGVLAAALLLGWMLLSGVGGFGFQNGDYVANNALLKDLATRPWPLTGELDGQTVRVVYYAGYYLPAGLVGRLLGWRAANAFLQGWTFAGMLLAFAWFLRAARLGAAPSRPWRVPAAALFFIFASGMDVIGWVLVNGTPYEPGAHMEPWGVFFQFSSITSLLFWVPQHALAAWLLAGLCADLVFDPSASFRPIGPAFAAALMWSPFAVLGAAPALLLAAGLALARGGGRALWGRESLVLNLPALWLALVNALYIGANRFQFDAGPLWLITGKHRSLVIHQAWLYVLEFGLLLALLLILAALARVKIERPQALLLGVSTLGLGLLPFFKIGIYNDLVMRGSMPSLFFFWAFACTMMLDAPPQLRAARRPAAGWGIYALCVLVFLVGAVTPLNEITRSVTRYHAGAPDFSSVKTVLTANTGPFVRQRVGSPDALFFQIIGK